MRKVRDGEKDADKLRVKDGLSVGVARAMTPVSRSAILSSGTTPKSSFDRAPAPLW